MNECAFCECDKPIEPEYVLCYRHNRQRTRGSIDECPNCDRFKRERYDVCIVCNEDATSPHPNSCELESSPAWQDDYTDEPIFFVYILKLDGGKFYAGQTGELRERLSEHRDGRTRSTAGRNPKLVWFDKVASRGDALEYERELQEDIRKNPRKIRREINAFHDLVRELDFS